MLTILLLVSTQLMWPPMIGLADNGDFGRMIKWGALNHVEDGGNDIYFNWVIQR